MKIKKNFVHTWASENVKIVVYTKEKKQSWRMFYKIIKYVVYVDLIILNN